ncbi:M1 family metallopeptidase [Nocardioides sp. C4-1]|uniref:M1 family metallopeptidase n=1 Tax=Nocardioides sp. C4-1 TaxID=3151851 RepID=UPI003262CEE8
MRRGAAALVCALVAGTALAGCGSDDADRTPSVPSSSTAASTTPAPDDPEPAEPQAAPPANLDLALSEPAEDSLYPDVGHPGVDALHYDLTLAWDPTTDTLTGDEVLTFRSTTDAPQFQLDLSDALEVTSVRIDDADAAFEHRGQDLVVDHPVTADERYAVSIRYRGTPEPAEAPTERSDFDGGLGFTIDDEHQVWTMQEPFGAFTYYAVNDHPSDKALYDFTLWTVDPMVGVANGAQVSDERAGIARRTRYHLAEPAASYLVTIAFGDYTRTADTGPGGLPISYWTFADEPVPDSLFVSPDAIAWLEEKLGPYPFDTAGLLVVDSESAMETQTMVTLGNTSHALAESTIVHEYAHHWYGDQVTPNDWRDLWMNEGMAMYLEIVWTAERNGQDLDAAIADIAPYEASYRADDGPPGDFDPENFASGGVYYSGAMLWHALRQRIGDDDRFWEIVAGWPASRDNASSDRETLLAYLEQTTGDDLDEFWDAWLLGTTTPG